VSLQCRVGTAAALWFWKNPLGIDLVLETRTERGTRFGRSLNGVALRPPRMGSDLSTQTALLGGKRKGHLHLLVPMPFGFWVCDPGHFLLG
jgi:hypothetical protein